MPRICYVILAHDEPINLLGVIGSLWNREDVFSIWLDAKANEEVIRVANALSTSCDNVKTSLGRAMSWGGFSVVDTTLMAYSALRSQFGDFSYVILCSGTHIPLLHPDRIYKRVQSLDGWMDCCQIQIPEGGLRERDRLPSGWTRDILTRIRYRYEEVPCVGMLPTGERDAWMASSFLEGSQWHILSAEIIDFIVEHQSEVRANFQDVRVPDEHAFQWIVSQAPRSGELQRGDHVSMEWKNWSPRRLTFPEAMKVAALGQFLFARKAHSTCTVEDWTAWAHDILENVQGAQRLQEASPALCGVTPQFGGFDGAARGERLCSQLLNSLELELSIVLGIRIKSRKCSDWRYVIDSGIPFARGAQIFFLCFAEPSLGMAVVPALRHADLGDDDPMRLLPRPRFFPEFVNLTLGGQTSWRIGLTNTLLNCKEFTNAVLTHANLSNTSF